MGREIRRVPANWVHPKSARTGRFEPLSQNYEGHLDDWLAESSQAVANIKTLMAGGEVEAYGEVFTNAGEYYDRHSQYNPDMPSPQDFMPEGDWYQLFEDTSEGTPVSDPFETADELKIHLTTKGDYQSSEVWSEKAVDNLLSYGFTPTAVFIMPAGELQPTQSKL